MVPAINDLGAGGEVGAVQDAQAGVADVAEHRGRADHEGGVATALLGEHVLHRPADGHDVAKRGAHADLPELGDQVLAGLVRVVGGEGEPLAGVAQLRQRVDGARGGLPADPDAAVEVEDELVVAGGERLEKAPGGRCLYQPGRPSGAARARFGAMAEPIEVTDADFEQRVIERSAELPVVVDFWADWCQPCHMLAPVIERAVDAQGGKVELAKLDSDNNQATAARYGIRGLPTVKAFRDGEVVDEFTGAQPPAVVERFVESLVPSPADELAAAAATRLAARALEVDPDHEAPRGELARLLLARGDAEEARELLRPADERLRPPGPRGADTAGGDDRSWRPPSRRGTAAITPRRWRSSRRALGDRERRDLIRRVMVALFTELGADDPLARDYRRRLSAALY